MFVIHHSLTQPRGGGGGGSTYVKLLQRNPEVESLQYSLDGIINFQAFNQIVAGEV